MYILIWLLMFSFGAHAEKMNVVPFRPKSSVSVTICESRLDKRREAQVIAFPSAIPPYQTISEFFRSEDRDVYFFDTGREDRVFLDPLVKTWSPVPGLPVGEWLYILKAEPRATTEPAIPQGQRLSLQEVRGRYRAKAFTKLRVPKIFRVVHGLIAETRGIESHEMRENFEPARIDYSALAAPALNTRALEAIVNSWNTKTDHEAEVKALLKEWLARTGLSGDDRRDCRNLSDQLAPRIQSLFQNSRFASMILNPLWNECL